MSSLGSRVQTSTIQCSTCSGCNILTKKTSLWEGPSEKKGIWEDVRGCFVTWLFTVISGSSFEVMTQASALLLEH